MRRPPTHLLVGGLGALAAVALAVGVGVATRDDAEQAEVAEGPAVVVVGDSIAVGSSEQITDALGGEVEISAVSGITFERQLPEASRLAERAPDHAVIELGSNDVLHGLPIDVSIDHMETMVETFRDAGTACVHLVDVNTSMVAPDGRTTSERAAAINAAMLASAAADDGVVVIAWDAAVREASARGDDLVPDTVHPDLAGAAVLADLIAASVADGCEAPA